MVVIVLVMVVVAVLMVEVIVVGVMVAPFVVMWSWYSVGDPKLK